MFIHNFKYSLKVLLKNRMLIFWTFAFPLILGTFFYLAFSNIESNEKLDIIDVAIVNNDNFNNSKVLKESFKTLSDENSENRIFNTKYVNDLDADKNLVYKTNLKITNKFTLKFLSKADFTWPEITKDYIEKILKNL